MRTTIMLVLYEYAMDANLRYLCVEMSLSTQLIRIIIGTSCSDSRGFSYTDTRMEAHKEEEIRVTRLHQDQERLLCAGSVDRVKIQSNRTSDFPTDRKPHQPAQTSCGEASYHALQPIKKVETAVVARIMV